MRRYYQGTLDYFCGIYAVVNALSCIHSLDLAGARNILQECLHEFSARKRLWLHFTRNETDHYWVVRYALRRWCPDVPGRACSLSMRQPFSDCLLPDCLPPWAKTVDRPDAALPRNAFQDSPEAELDRIEFCGDGLYLPEEDEAFGPASDKKAAAQAEAVWLALAGWFQRSGGRPRSALLRFHRFAPQVSYPVVSHWTTVRAFDGAVHLLDSSSEAGAVLRFAKSDLLNPASRPLLRIVPESLLLLEEGL